MWWFIDHENFISVFIYHFSQILLQIIQSEIPKYYRYFLYFILYFILFYTILLYFILNLNLSYFSKYYRTIYGFTESIIYLLCNDDKSKSMQAVRDDVTAIILPLGSLNVSFRAILILANIDATVDDRFLHLFSIIVPFFIIPLLNVLHLAEEGTNVVWSIKFDNEFLIKFDNELLIKFRINSFYSFKLHTILLHLNQCNHIFFY